MPGWPVPRLEGQRRAQPERVRQTRRAPRAARRVRCRPADLGAGEVKRGGRGSARPRSARHPARHQLRARPGPRCPHKAAPSLAPWTVWSRPPQFAASTRPRHPHSVTLGDTETLPCGQIAKTIPTVTQKPPLPAPRPRQAGREMARVASGLARRRGVLSAVVVPAAPGSAGRAASSPVALPSIQASLSCPSQRTPGVREGRPCPDPFPAGTAEPAASQARGQAPPGRGGVRRPAHARRPSPASTGCPAGPRSSRPAPLSEKESHALAHLRWIIERFRDAEEPGWTAPGDESSGSTSTTASWPPSRPAAWPRRSPDGRGPARRARRHRAGAVQGAGSAAPAAVRRGGRPRTAAPADRATRFPVAERITDPRVKAPPPVRTAGGPPASSCHRRPRRACAELGLPALLLAAASPAGRPG